MLKVFLENVIRDAVTYTEHAYDGARSKPTPVLTSLVLTLHCSLHFSLRRRKTVYASDVVHALRRQGRTLCTMHDTRTFKTLKPS